METRDVYKSIPWTADESISWWELIKVMVANDIPYDARIQYQGCGSHAIEFWWKEEVKPDRGATTQGLVSEPELFAAQFERLGQ